MIVGILCVIMGNILFGIPMRKQLRFTRVGCSVYLFLACLGCKIEFEVPVSVHRNFLYIVFLRKRQHVVSV